MTEANEQTLEPSASFEKDIRPLFREGDRTAMHRAFDLWSYEDVRTHQDAIVSRLADGSMPCDGPWSDEDIARFRAWITGGSRP